STLRLALLLGAALGSARAAVYFQEQFLDRGWARWVSSEYKVDLRRFKLPAGKFYGDAVYFFFANGENCKFNYYIFTGLQTSRNSEFYTLVIQYTVKHEQKIDCGGGYVKNFSSNLDQKNLSGDSHYYIMFGPDICGSEIRKVHFSRFLKIELAFFKTRVDGYTHLYTLIIRKINDPTVRKPSEDWDDLMQIDDPNDIKPEDWDEPEYVMDTSAGKPEDWDDAVNGEWHYPMVKNPLYRGEWKPRQIDNPNYRGVWPHPQIDNPNYSPDFSIYSYENIGIIGLDIWQVRSGTIFDNFLITDDEVYAEDFGNETWGRTEGPEKEMNIKQTEEEQERERVTEEKYFEQQFKEKLERKKESGKDRAVRNTTKKEEL
uniref:Calreticulin 3 n=1 Tax=Strix occidentalis caurina TaxID=311401 RepID=A0A8D0EHF7_STROC